ncbi:hypothetical protein [Phenylobacterium soli]|uniref:Uncharacterized protein n=1 Tax=Phenylobacterium soli TaxID=2170551 RepID=A0A328ANI9_9CAUL|nr:hypothetical protein [Phenylobacterium soli]RAK56139.1 hypothetical protein DJ017_17275 [Phenylobacterium soli]
MSKGRSDRRQPAERLAGETRSFAPRSTASGETAVTRLDPRDPTEAEAMARIRAALADPELTMEALKLVSEALDVLQAGLPRKPGGRRSGSASGDQDTGERGA